MSKQKTMEEVREEFLRTVSSISNYWSNLTDKTDAEKCDGVAFSILSMLDGCNASLPGFIVAPLPHEDDKAYRKESDEDWYPQNHNSRVKCDISGGLHELYYKYKEK